MQDEEIDLTQLYNSFKQTIVYKKLNLLLSFVRSNIIWFAIFLLSGIALGYYVRMKEVPVYKSEMLLKSKYLNNDSSVELIKSLNILYEENNMIELNNVGFSDELVQSIKKIEFVYPEEITDSLKKVEPFKVVVESEQNQLFSSIEDAIFKYLSNNPASLADENKNKEALIAESTELKKKLADLDRMQSLIYQYFYSNREELKGQPMIVDPASVLKERRETFARITEIEKELKEVNNYEVIQKMTPKLYPEKKSIKPIVVFPLIFIFLGGFILALIKKPTL